MHGIGFCKIQLKTKVCELEIVPTSRVEFQHYIFLVVKKHRYNNVCCAVHLQGRVVCLMESKVSERPLIEHSQST